MNHISGKLEQLLALQETLCKEYEKENKVLLETIKAQKEQIYLLERIVNNQNKIIKELYWSSFFVTLCSINIYL